MSKCRKFSLFSLFALFVVSLSAQDIYHTHTNSNLIKTLQVKVEGQLLSDPFMELDGENRIEINFDVLGHPGGRLMYSIIHCNADWKRSDLSSIEYMNGFQGLILDDFANSMATTTSYTNYRLLLPNDEVQFKVSGNYAVSVSHENEPDTPLFTACFSLVEPAVLIEAVVSGKTMIDAGKEHQQVSFSINHRNFPVTYPQTDLKVYVYQNNRRDNMVTNPAPTTILDGQLLYEHNRDLIFEAGNEYRRIEFLSNRYNGLGVNEIQYHNPYYHVELMPNRVRNHIPYQYDRDQNGRFVIRCSGCSDPDTEADYYIVHFALESDPFPDGVVYLSGELLNNVLNENSRMGYNFETGRYEKSILLKQGNYNYQYLFVPNTETKGRTGLLEGNYFQTENQYTIMVYFRPIGVRYDKLIGICKTGSQLNPKAVF